jgi:meso-butanediol dehydrogenase / (S,S)-butanediol dehydrogenase / diacetyl reductase
MSGRIVVITGGISGIGRATAKQFTALGDTVIVLDRTPSEASPDFAVSYQVSVDDEQGVISTIDDIIAKYKKVDVLVNNAGKCTDIDFIQFSADDWDREFGVNLKGPFLLCRAVLPHMISQKSGCIINVGTVNMLAYYGNEAYSASKAGLESLTRSLAVRMGQHNIRVNIIAPGTIRTPAWDKRIARDPLTSEKLLKYYPLGRLGEATDIASAVRFLASDDAKWITGTTLRVDGGLLAGNGPMTVDRKGTL